MLALLHMYVGAASKSLTDSKNVGSRTALIRRFWPRSVVWWCTKSRATVENAQSVFSAISNRPSCYRLYRRQSVFACSGERPSLALHSQRKHVEGVAEVVYCMLFEPCITRCNIAAPYRAHFITLCREFRLLRECYRHLRRAFFRAFLRERTPLSFVARQCAFFRVGSFVPVSAIVAGDSHPPRTHDDVELWKNGG